MASFDVLLNSTGLRGSAPYKRTVGIYELGAVAFAKALKSVKHDRRKLVRWLSEAIKRFGAPVLTIAYTLIGLGLVIRGLGGRGDRWWRLHGIFGLIAISHVAIMLAAEGGINIDLRIAWVIVAVILIEVAIGVLLISHSTFQGAMLRFLRSRQSLQRLARISNGTGDRGVRPAAGFHREPLELEPVAGDAIRRRGGQG
jgi:hypothetical protein